jgi:hypothetical protein
MYSTRCLCEQFCCLSFRLCETSGKNDQFTYLILLPIYRRIEGKGKELYMDSTDSIRSSRRVGIGAFLFVATSLSLGALLAILSNG